VSSLRLVFAGTPQFAAAHLEALLDSRHHMLAVLTQPDRPGARGRQLQPSAVKRCAQAAGLPVLQPPNLRDADAQHALAELQIDALVVVAYGLILPQAVLDLPRFACVNVHASLLPRWRGAAPIQRAIEAGDRETGVTIMRMEAGLDTGPMLATRRCPIAAGSTSGELEQQLAGIGPPLLLEVLADLPGYLAAATAQDDSAASYAAKLNKADAQIDWHRPAAALAAQIHAFNPNPGCFTTLDGQRIKLWRATALPGGSHGDPGQIADTAGSGIAVCCGEGLLLISELQLPGARALPAAEVLRGNAQRLYPGLRFDSPAP
jgi:methionyl-tRNA formyltransferase